MAAFFSLSTTKIPTLNLSLIIPLSPFINAQFKKPSFSSSVSYPKPRPPVKKLRCLAAEQKSGPPVKKKKREKKSSGYANNNNNKGGLDLIEDDDGEGFGPPSSQSSYQPKPPAGFVVDDQGRVLMVSNKRLTTIVDDTNNLPLECVIRRVFRSSRGDECMLLCPVDTPVQMLKSTSFDDWLPVSDDEFEALLPTAAYALAKIHMHLVYSGFSYTARGGFSFSEEDIFEFQTEDGDVDGTVHEGVEITVFHSDGANYMLYTPADPLLFVAVKDKNGKLQIADDELLEDQTIISAIDEETEFNALVQAEEAALIDAILGED
ncbi:hypothetical protein LguiB_016941 [Lonicera macranthoides]